MKEREAKTLFPTSTVVSPHEKGWKVVMWRFIKPHTLTTKRSHDPRIFRTADTALRWCKRMGCNRVEVEL